MKLQWLTTTPNPHVVSFTAAAGQRGWKLHLVELGQYTWPSRRHGQPVTLDKSPALCGLRAAHGWGLDMFIEDECARCVAIAEKRGIALPEPLDGRTRIDQRRVGV